MDISVLLAIRAIMDNANIDIYLEVFVWTDVFISFGYITISEIAGSYGNFLIIRGTNRLFFKATAPFYIQQCTGFQFLHIFANTCLQSFLSQPS